MWVDQLCINQSDQVERSHQVGFMSNIYQCAQQTLICLSTSKTKARGMEWLIELCKNVPSQEDDVPEEEAESTPFLQDGMGMDESQELEIPIDRYHWHRLQEFLWRNIENDRFTNGWIAFYDVVESPWWSRAWVFQEFIASSAASLLYSRSSVSWRDASPILNSFCSTHKSILTNRKWFFELTEFELGGQQDRQLCRIIDRIARTNSQAALDTVYFMVKTKIEWIDGSIGLKKLLAHSRYCNASDDRDRIYAFFGLASSGYDIIPNYSTDNVISNVLIETTKKIILFEDGLDVLCHAAVPNLSRRSMLPSWVVDWTCREDPRMRNNHFGTSSYRLLSDTTIASANASFCTVKSPKKPDGTVALEVCGVFLGELAVRQINNLSSPEQEKLFRSFRTPNYVVCTSYQAECSDQLWFLRGASVPMILRREHHGYLLISSASTIPISKERSMRAIAEELFETDDQYQRILII